MTIVRIDCGFCHTHLELEASLVRVDYEDGASSGTYTYDCPACGHTLTVRERASTMALMIDNGCTRVGEPIEPHDLSAPPLTADDLLDFGLALSRMDEVSQ